MDDRVVLKPPRRGATLREEVWQTGDGRVTRYNLAYINPLQCSADHGRVLGYDNSHGMHYRHWMGHVETVEFSDYESPANRFQREVRELWRKEDEEDA